MYFLSQFCFCSTGYFHGINESGLVKFLRSRKECNQQKLVYKIFPDVEKKLSLNFNHVSLKIPNDTECGLERAKSYQVLKRCRSGLVLNL